MSSFRISTSTHEAEAALKKVRDALTPSKVDHVVQRVAFVTYRRLVTRTPKRWTGHTRKSWRVTRNGAANYTVTNRSKVMVFLEEGTKAHGPVKAKRLFIPKNRRAAFAGPAGVFAANKAAQASGSKLPFIIGRDYLLVTKVRGIKALHIVRDHRPFAATTLRSGMRQYIKYILTT